MLKTQKKMWYLLSLSFYAQLSLWHGCQLTLGQDTGGILEYIWRAVKTEQNSQTVSVRTDGVNAVEQRHMVHYVGLCGINNVKESQQPLFTCFLIFQADSIDVDSLDKPPTPHPPTHGLTIAFCFLSLTLRASVGIFSVNQRRHTVDLTNKLCDHDGILKVWPEVWIDHTFPAGKFKWYCHKSCSAHSMFSPTGALPDKTSSSSFSLKLSNKQVNFKCLLPWLYYFLARWIWVKHSTENPSVEAQPPWVLNCTLGR